MRIPRYVSVADEIRAEISATDFRHGDLLPSEAEFGSRFGVSRITIRKALEILRGEGLVESQQGRGWVVTRAPLRQVLGEFSTIERQLEEIGVVPRRRIIASRVIEATGRLQEVLGGGEVLEVTRVNLADGVPFAKVTVWVPAYLGRGLSITDLEHRSFYDLLSASRLLKRPLKRAVQTIAGVSIPEVDARILNVAAGVPGLLCERITFDEGDHPVLFSRSLFPASMAVFEIELAPALDSIAPTGLRLMESP
ncbi:MAG: GntR family transcriptional regulator [Ferrimicrobium sp.]|uniref:GntR family transcriptional regulator n=1 Tax=Ferrimicrobium acidiphilum TaxID=121039 RepID=A0ABV3Y3B5_9ACTN|nr:MULTISPECIES: GntR family transcriptional regulator [Ferrimicrobium]